MICHGIRIADLPWNPNRLEQRFGRIHRIGQTEVCHLWNLVANETREGDVFKRLFQKLEEERQALGGKVFDILGKVTFEDRSLRDLLIEAIRYGNRPDVRNQLNQVVDHAMNREAFQRLIDERALTNDIMNVNIVNKIREDMERIEAHKLQPHFIEAFFLEAFKKSDGVLRKREPGRYEIISVPPKIRNQNLYGSYGETIVKRYERVCFDKAYCQPPGQVPAVLLCPGHPLLEAVISLIREHYAHILKRGATLIDETDYSKEARLLFYIEDAIQDGATLKDGSRHILSKHIHFVEIRKNGSALSAGYAPYLDYRPLQESEKNSVMTWLSQQDWLSQNIENLAKNYAIQYLIPQHLKDVKTRKEAYLDKLENAVNGRMKAEIQYWDGKTAELKQKEKEGKKNARINSVTAEQRAEYLAGRKDKRLAEIKNERSISSMPPNITGGALIIPMGLLMELQGNNLPDVPSPMDKRRIELAAMRAVMTIETDAGYLPRDVSAEKCGYDIESRVPESKRSAATTSTLRFIEVKGRHKGATTVTVSKNEILTALNKPDEFILALVEVDGRKTHTVYLQCPFTNAPDFTATSVNFDINELIEKAKCIYEK